MSELNLILLSTVSTFKVSTLARNLDSKRAILSRINASSQKWLFLTKVDYQSLLLVI